MKRCRLDLLFAFLAAGCGGGETSPQASVAPQAVSPPSSTVQAPSAPATSAPPSTPAPSAPPPPSTTIATTTTTIPDGSVDLLHAAATTVVASSVYHDDESQLPRLVDGDPSTAWNARTGELLDASLAVRIPDGATVHAIQMTVGFTREGGTTDLFTGNQRIARVRVSHQGGWVGEYDLDVGSRELQTLPVAGGPGVYRIDVAALTPGTRTDWREVCVSELRVMGDPGTAAAAGATPTFVVGMDEVIADVDTENVDAAEHRWDAATEAFMRTWGLSTLGSTAVADRSDAALAAAESSVEALFVGTDADLATINRCSWQANRLTTRLTRLSDQVFLDGQRRIEDDLGDRALRSGESEDDHVPPEQRRFLTDLNDLDERLGAEDRALARAVLAYSNVPPEYGAAWNAMREVATETLARCAEVRE